MTAAPLLVSMDDTHAARKRRALIAAMDDAELIAAAQHHANTQTLRFIADEQAIRQAERLPRYVLSAEWVGLGWQTSTVRTFPEVATFLHHMEEMITAGRVTSFRIA